MKSIRERLGDDRGAAPLEVLMWTPMILIFFAITVYTGRATSAVGNVDDAAQAAARAASLVRDPADAAGAAQQAAVAALPVGDERCAAVGVVVDISEWFDPGIVQVEVTCQLIASDFALLGIGDGNVTSVWFEPVDHARRVAEIP